MAKVLVLYDPGSRPNWVYALPMEDESIVLDPALYPELGSESLFVVVDDPEAFSYEDAVAAIASKSV